MEEDGRIIEALSDKIFYVAKTSDPAGKAVCDEFGVRLFPTFVVLNSDGETVARWIGYPDPEAWIGMLELAAADPVPVTERRERLASAPNAVDAVVLGRYARGTGEYAEAEACFRKALEVDRPVALENDVPMLRFRSMYNGVGRGAFTVDESWEIIDDVRRSGELSPADLLEMSVKLGRVVDIAGEERVASFLREVHPAVKDHHSEIASFRREYGIYHALLVDKNAGEAVRLKKESLPDEWNSDPYQLNRFAWWCFECGINLEEAEKLARKAIDSIEPGTDRANIMDTLAEILHARGDTEGALSWIEKAVELNPDSEYLQGQRTRFREILNEA